MKIEKSAINVGWWVATITINGVQYMKAGDNKLKIIDDLFAQLNWSLN